MSHFKTCDTRALVELVGAAIAEARENGLCDTCVFRVLLSYMGDALLKSDVLPLDVAANLTAGWLRKVTPEKAAEMRTDPQHITRS